MKYKNLDKIMNAYVDSHRGDRESDLIKFKEKSVFYPRKRTYFKAAVALCSLILAFAIALPVGIKIAKSGDISYEKLSAISSFEINARVEEGDPSSTIAGDTTIYPVTLPECEGIEPIREIMLPNIHCKKISVTHLSKKNKGDEVVCVSVEAVPMGVYIDNVSVHYVFEEYNIKEFEGYDTLPLTVEWEGYEISYSVSANGECFNYSLYYKERDIDCFMETVCRQEIEIEYLLERLFKCL